MLDPMDARARPEERTGPGWARRAAKAQAASDSASRVRRDGRTEG